MKIVIVGAGRVGYAIAEQLLTEGHDITVVESDPERAAYISSTLDVIVVEGRANVDQLRIANVADADLLIAATTSDETNLISCMVGRKLGATHTIARVRDEEYYQDVALLQDELGLSLSINPERTSAKEISRTLRFPAATKVEPFANGLVELVEFKLREGSKLDGLRLNDFRGRYSDGILICAVEREGSVTIPNGDFVLAAGDYVTVVARRTSCMSCFARSASSATRPRASSSSAAAALPSGWRWSWRVCTSTRRSSSATRLAAAL